MLLIARAHISRRKPDAGPTSVYYYVMFRLHLSARPATVSINMPADSGDSSCLICAPLCLGALPRSPSFSLLSAPVCGDAARLEEQRDVFFGLRGPHQPGSGPSQQGLPHSGGGFCQVRTKTHGDYERGSRAHHCKMQNSLFTLC